MRTVARTPRQRGMALVAALFLIVVLAALGVFAVRINATQEQSINLMLLRERAVAAANSGIEFGAYRALVANSCPVGTVPLTLTQAALSGFTVQVTTTRTSHVLNGTAYWVCRIDALATRGKYGRPDYVSRAATRTVTNAP